MRMDTYCLRPTLQSGPQKFAGYYRNKVESGLYLGSYPKEDGGSQDVWVTSEEQRQLMTIDQKKRNYDTTGLKKSDPLRKKLDREKRGMLDKAKHQFEAEDRVKASKSQQSTAPAQRPKTFFDYVEEMIEEDKAEKARLGQQSGSSAQ